MSKKERAKRLRELEAALEAQGGRGVELAEEIDALRLELEEGQTERIKVEYIVAYSDNTWVSRTEIWLEDDFSVLVDPWDITPDSLCEVLATKREQLLDRDGVSPVYLGVLHFESLESNE